MQKITIDLNLPNNVQAVEGEHNADALCVKLPASLQGYPVYVIRRMDGYGRVSDSPRLYAEGDTLTMHLTNDILRGRNLKLQVIGFNNDETEISKSEIFHIPISPSLILNGEEEKKSNDLLSEMLDALSKVSSAVSDAENAVSNANQAVESANQAVELANQTANTMSQEIAELTERVRPFNIFTTDATKIYKNSDLNLTTGEIKSGTKTVYELPLRGGEQYYINGLNNSRNHTLFLDAEMQYVTNMTAIGYYGAVVTLPENTAFVRFVHTVGYNPVIIDSKDYKKFKDGFMAELDESVDILPALPSALPSALHSALPSALPPALNSALPSALPLSLQNDFIQYINSLNPDTVTKGAFVIANGKLGTNANYDCSDYISISEGMTYYLFTRSLSKFTPRTVCYFDANKNSITEAFMDSSAQTSSYIIPYVQGAAYIRITLPAGKASDYLVSLDNNPIKFIGYGEYRIRDSLLADISFGSELKAAYSLCGGNAMKKYVDTATSGTVVTLPDFPRNLKKGLSLTFFGKFNDFTLLALGKGRGEYRGDWLEIDNKNIVWKHFEREETVVDTVAHELNVSTFLAVAINVDNDSVCRCAVSTLNETKVFTFNWMYEQNGTPFAYVEQNTTDVELGAVANDIKSPVWLFGDSYFGVGSNRIIGQLKNLGYADGCLIDGLAGQDSSEAYKNFTSLLSLGGTPKTLVWCLGMNDSAENYQKYLGYLEQLSEKNGFEIILQKIPVVPERIAANKGVNQIVEASGHRYVDAYKAVGADDSGTWYADYLSSDSVHPSVNGAKAIASRMLIDVPELMQYGYNQGSIGGGITGDR